MISRTEADREQSVNKLRTRFSHFPGSCINAVKARRRRGSTSDSGVLLLQIHGRSAGLAECFRNHRDPRLIEHIEELLGQRIYGLCLGYEDRTIMISCAPTMAVAVNKA